VCTVLRVRRAGGRTDVVDNLYGKIYVQDRPKKVQLRSGPSVRSGPWSTTEDRKIGIQPYA